MEPISISEEISEDEKRLRTKIADLILNIVGKIKMTVGKLFRIVQKMCIRDRLFGTVNNRNSVGIEMCVQAGYNYEKAFQNTVRLCKQLMKQLGIPADRVVQHSDVCAKNCPSAIRAKGDCCLLYTSPENDPGAERQAEIGRCF